MLTDFGTALRAATGLRPARSCTATAPDGYPVHGWLVLPDGPGPHPVLLVVHGGPHAAYGPALFDEAQVYAAAGYAVVLGNPRGSAGYGQRACPRRRRHARHCRRRRRAGPARRGAGPARLRRRPGSV